MIDDAAALKPDKKLTLCGRRDFHLAWSVQHRAHIRRSKAALALILIQSHRASEAIAECERALSLNPNLAQAHAYKPIGL